MDAKILELRQGTGQQALLSFLRQSELLLALPLLLQVLKTNHLAAGLEFSDRLLQHFAVVLRFQVQQAHFQNVVNARAQLGQIERLADEILSAASRARTCEPAAR